MKSFFRDTLVICFGLFCCLFVPTCKVWIARLRIGDCLWQTGLFALVEYWWLTPPKMRIWSVFGNMLVRCIGAGQFAGLKSTDCLPERQPRLKGAQES